MSQLLDGLTERHAAAAEASQAVRAAGAVTPAQTARRYLRGMIRRGELLPGSAEKIVPHVVDRNGYRPDATLRNIDAFLAGDGKAYLNPEYLPDATEPPLKAAFRRFVGSRDEADALYRKHVLDYAESGGGNAAVFVFNTFVAAGQAARVGAGEDDGFMPPDARKPLSRPNLRYGGY